MESEWLRHAIRLSLKASIFASISDDEKGPPEQRDPRFRKLVEGILFSRKFVPTYHLVTVGFLCVLSVVHWGKKATRWRRRRDSRLRTLVAQSGYGRNAEFIKPNFCTANNFQELNGTIPPDSSTIEGTVSPPRKNADEQAPLLHRGHSRRLRYPRRSSYATIKALLMYQPRPIPILKRALPSNGISITVLGFLFLNIFYMFFHINLNTFELFVLADRFGLVFVANLPLLYLLAAKNQPLKLLTGRSYESLNIFHRRLGELLCLEAFLHSAGMTAVWYTLIRPSGFSFLRFLLIKMILLGMGAYISFVLLYFTSLGSFRKRWYEVFLGIHVVCQFAALTLLFFHHSTARPYVAAALAIFLLDRLVYRIGIKSTTIGTYTKILEDEDTVRLSSTVFIRSGRWTALFGRSVLFGWQSTDHVFLTVPSLSGKHIIQAHPFTIASNAPRLGDEEGRLELLVRAQDGFSRDLLNAARLHKHLIIRLDGPYGSSYARAMLEDADLALVIAGGSGIAVGFPLIHHLLDTFCLSDTEIAPTSSLLRQKIILIWVIHEESHLSWVGRQALEDAENRGAEIIIPRATEEIGRPNLRGMISEIVGKSAGGMEKKTGVVVSGPDGMGRTVRNSCAGLVRDGRKVDVTIEKFGW